jgi:proteic killer suppression protein
MDKVIFDKVQKQLTRVPSYVVDKLMAWAMSVEMKGLRDVRKIPGYHDEPLKGQRQGERSIRLSKGYRAIYIQSYDGTVNLVILEEVSKHEY